MKFEISAEKREAQGTGASRRLRRLGKVPGIVYGGDQGPINIELEHQDLFLNLRNEKFHAPRVRPVLLVRRTATLFGPFTSGTSTVRPRR